MRIVINILLGLSSLFAVLVIASFIYGLATDGFSNGAGMAILFFQLWGFIGSVAAGVLGRISWVMSRNAEGASTLYGKIGVGIGIAGVLILVLMLFF